MTRDDMLPLIFALGILVLLSGGVIFMVPEKAWRKLTTRGSRWRNQASTAGLLLFLGLGWLGLMLVMVCASAVWLGWRSTQWEPVSGTVIESRLIATSQIRSTNPAYRAQVVYSYTMDGKEHRGMRVDFTGTSTPDRTWVEETLRTRFAPGALLTVHVDPQSAGESVIEPGVPPEALIFGALGLALLAIGIWQVRVLLCDWNFENGVAALDQRLVRKEQQNRKKSR